MSPFEYITVLVSIILGLGITQVVTGVADMIHQWERIRLYWPHLLWILLVFFLQIQEWWQIYELRHYAAWRLPTFILLSSYPIVLFILARILFPISLSEEVTDFKKFYFDNYRKFFLVTIVSAVLAVLIDILIMGYDIRNQPFQIGLTLLMTILVMVKPKAEWIHKLLVLTMVIAMLTSIAITWNEWLITN